MDKPHTMNSCNQRCSIHKSGLEIPFSTMHEFHTNHRTEIPLEYR